MHPLTDNERRAGLEKLANLFGLVFRLEWHGPKIASVRVVAMKPIKLS